MTSEGIRPYGPGKFDTVLDAYVYELSLAGCDDEMGEDGRWYGLLKGIQVDGAFCDASSAQGLNTAELRVCQLFALARGATSATHRPGAYTIPSVQIALAIKRAIERKKGN